MRIRHKILENGCWEFVGHIEKSGYGRIKIKGKMFYAHRYYYQRFRGIIPYGLEIDHLCNNRRCVNPEHLEAVTKRENIFRSNAPSAINKKKTRCAKGHEFTPENTYTYPKSGYRSCKICNCGISKKHRLTKRGSHDFPRSSCSI